MPAVKATAITIVERTRAERISILTTKHDLKTPDHGRLPATASTPADKWVRDGALLPVSLKIHMVECVGRSLRLDHPSDTEELCGVRTFVCLGSSISNFLRDRFVLCRCTSDSSVTVAPCTTVREDPACRLCPIASWDAVFVACENRLRPIVFDL
jgi:hypothetical protein